MTEAWAGRQGLCQRGGGASEGAWFIRKRVGREGASEGRGLRRGRVLEKGAVPGTGGA